MSLIQNDEIGFVDAHTGDIVATEARVLDYAANATFDTRYNGLKYNVTTQFYNNEYNLCDSSRNDSNGPIIHTWDLNNHYDNFNYYRRELTDENNYWSSDEYQYNEDDMGLDIHWSLQEIVDYLANEHGINSFDDQGIDIDAYFHFYNNYDGAGYIPALHSLFFGDGGSNYFPLASLDVVSHEFGHGITDYQIGWPYSGDPLAFNEGLSDIWAVILENRINPHSIWCMGEQITINNGCVRNIADPNGNNPEYAIADTYQSSYYNYHSDPHFRGGVLSHWFYLLVNGGSGTNGVYSDYLVYGIGMDAAEDLIVYAVMNNYLDNKSTYPQLRQAMIDAAEDRFENNAFLSMQVANAWYAVGVGDQPAQVYYSGPYFVCQSGAAFTVNNLPSGATISWSSSDNITLVSSPGSNPGEFESSESGFGWVNVSITYNNQQIDLGTKDVWSGVPLAPTFIYSLQYPPCIGSSDFYFNEPGNSIFTGYHWYLQSEFYSALYAYGMTAEVQVQIPQNITLSVNAENQCGFSDTYYTDPIFLDNCQYRMVLSPNPAKDRLKIELPDNSSQVTTMEINNSQGVKVISTTITGTEKTIDISRLPKGLYYITVFSNSKGKSKIKTERFIKE